MTDPQLAIGRIRYAANRAIDQPFAAFAAGIEALILERARTAQDGTKRIDAASVALIRADLLRRLLAMRDGLTVTIRAQIIAAESLAIEQFEATDPPEMPSTTREDALTAAALALLVTRALKRSMTQVDRVLVEAAVGGVDAAIPAARITLFFSPEFAARRQATGRLIRAAKPASARSWPAVAGNGSAGVRRIAEHEITSASGDMAIVLAQRTLGYGVRWELSPYHKQRDECDRKANLDNGFGRGIYRADSVPLYPSHVLCRCHLTAVQLDQTAGTITPPVSPPTPRWSPSMTEEEAKAWSSQSVMRDPLFHGTSAEGVASIPRDGFDLSLKSNGKFFGDGVYLSESRGIAETYAKHASGDVLKTRINVNNVIHVSEEIQGTDVLGSLSRSSPNGKRLLEIKDEIEAEGERLMAQANYRKFFNLSPEEEEARLLLDSFRFSDPNAAAINQFAKEESIDALRIANGGERDIDIWVVFDPKNVTVVT